MQQYANKLLSKYSTRIDSRSINDSSVPKSFRSRTQYLRDLNLLFPAFLKISGFVQRISERNFSQIERSIEEPIRTRPLRERGPAAPFFTGARDVTSGVGVRAGGIYNRPCAALTSRYLREPGSASTRALGAHPSVLENLVVSVGVRKMADGDIDLYADDIEQDFAQVTRTYL